LIISFLTCHTSNLLSNVWKLESNTGSSNEHSKRKVLQRGTKLFNWCLFEDFANNSAALISIPWLNHCNLEASLAPIICLHPSCAADCTLQKRPSGPQEILWKILKRTQREQGPELEWSRTGTEDATAYRSCKIQATNNAWTNRTRRRCSSICNGWLLYKWALMEGSKNHSWLHFNRLCMSKTLRDSD